MELKRKRKETLLLLVLIDGYAEPNPMPHSLFMYIL